MELELHAEEDEGSEFVAPGYCHARPLFRIESWTGLRIIPSETYPHRISMLIRPIDYQVCFASSHAFYERKKVGGV